MLSSLRRGLLAGGVGGLLAGLFSFLVAEPVMDRAVALEAARSRAAGEHVVELFSRHTQHVGGLVALLAAGLAFGTLYAVVHHLLSAHDPDRWGSAIRLGAAAFFGVSLVPYLRYPSNPPGVGDPATIDTRTHLYLVTLGIGVVGSCLAGLVARTLRERQARPSTRHLAVTAVLVAVVAAAFALPADTDQVAVPARLLWEFRLLSLAALLLLWGGLGAAYGLLAERARVRASGPG